MPMGAAATGRRRAGPGGSFRIPNSTPLSFVGRAFPLFAESDPERGGPAGGKGDGTDRRSVLGFGSAWIHRINGSVWRMTLPCRRFPLVGLAPGRYTGTGGSFKKEGTMQQDGSSWPIASRPHIRGPPHALPPLRARSAACNEGGVECPLATSSAKRTDR
jgi:hypothetical protein